MGLELQLIGNPTLRSNGRVLDIHPNKAFEILCYLICLQGQTISRKELVSHFWSHLNSQNGQLQLRIVLTKLRQQIQSTELESMLRLDGSNLSSLASVKIDLLEIEPARLNPKNFSTDLLQQAMIGWDREKWALLFAQQEEKIIKSAQTEWFKSCDTDEKLQMLRKAGKLFPTSVNIQLLLIKLLESVNRHSEVLDTVIRFEDHWVSRFGTSDLPDLKILSTNLSPEWAMSKVSARSSSFNWLRGILAIFLTSMFPILGTYFAIANLEHGNDNITINARTTVKIENQSYTVFQLVINEPLEHAQQVTNDEVILKTKHSVQSIKFKGMNTEVHILHDNLAPKRILSDLQNVNYVLEPIFNMYGINLWSLVCNHTARCHRTFEMIQNEKTFALNPVIKNAQVAVPTFVDKTYIYGKFSNGQSENWKYKTFRINLQTHTTEILKNEPVLLVTKTGDIVTLPEETTKFEDDYDTHWNGYIMVVDKKGISKKLKLGTRFKFSIARNLDETIISTLSNHGLNPHFIAFDINGDTIHELEPWLKGALNVDSLAFGKSILIHSSEKGLYFLIRKTEFTSE